MQISIAESVIASTGIAAECLVLVAWTIRSRHRPFWSVAVYAGYHLLFSVLMRAFHLRRHDLPDGAYFTDEAVDFSILLSVIAEMFCETVRQLQIWPLKLRRRSILAIVAGVAVAGVLVMSLTSSASTRTEAWDNRIDLLTSLLLCTFLIISGWITSRLSLQKVSKVRQIELGLALWAIAALIADICNMNSRTSLINTQGV